MIENPSQPKNRMESETQMAEELKNRGYITDYTIYADPKDFEHTDLEKIPKNLRSLYEILSKINSRPILIDDVEELTTNHTRTKYRAEILAISKEFRTFYDSNKLQSSEVLNQLWILNMIKGQKDESIFSSDMENKLEEIRAEFNGTPDPEAFSAFKYKSTLDNTAKLKLVKEVEKFVEEILEKIRAKGIS